MDPTFAGRQHLPWIRLSVVLTISALFPACSPDQSVDLLKERQAEVKEFSETLIKDLHDIGPSGWLLHFDPSEEFYMASDGNLVFPDADSATVFVNQLSETLDIIDLELLDLRQDHHSSGFVSIASPYEESITDKQGSVILFGGFVTMLLIKNGDEWKIRNLHWSSPANED